VRRRSALHPRRTAAQLRRLPEPADRAVVDEAAAVGCLIIVIIIIIIIIISCIAGEL